MNYYVPEIEEFEFKANILAKRLQHLSVSSCTDYIEINSLSEILNIEEKDMKSLIYYLKRGEIIKTDRDVKNVTLTEYGKMIYCDNHRVAYAPIVG